MKLPNKPVATTPTSPARRQLLVGAAAAALLGACGGSDDDAVPVVAPPAAGFSGAIYAPLATADGFVDITVTSDGRYVYQLLGLRGTINVYSAASTGALQRLQQATGLLPMTNLAGLVSVDRRVP